MAILDWQTVGIEETHGQESIHLPQDRTARPAVMGWHSAGNLTKQPLNIGTRIRDFQRFPRTTDAIGRVRIVADTRRRPDPLSLHRGTRRQPTAEDLRRRARQASCMVRPIAASEPIPSELSSQLAVRTSGQRPGDEGAERIQADQAVPMDSPFVDDSFGEIARGPHGRRRSDVRR